MVTRAMALAWPQHDEVSRRRRSTLIALMLGSWLLVLFSSSNLIGQEPYETLPINENFDLDTPPAGLDLNDRDDKRAWSKLRSERNNNRKNVMNVVKAVLSGDASYAQQKAIFDRWFAEVVFPAMTSTTQEGLEELPKARRDFFNLYMRNAKSPQMVDTLSRVVAFPTLRKIAEGNYHPAARVNAIVLMGRLNSREGVRKVTPPQPLSEAFIYMLDNVLLDDTKPMYLRAATLPWIQRHVDIDAQLPQGRIPPAYRQKVIDKMIAIANEPPVPNDGGMQSFMQRQAIRVLGALREPGSSQEVANLLLTKINDDTSSIGTKCDAMVAYANLKHQAVSDEDMNNILARIGEVALNAARSEVDFLDEESNHLKTLLARESVTVSETIDTTLGGPAEDDYGSDYGDDEGGEEEDYDDAGYGDEYGDDGSYDTGDPNALPKYKLDTARRRLKTVLYYMRNALGENSQVKSGLSRFDKSTDPNASLITQLKKSFDVIDKAADTTIEDEEFGIELETQLKDQITTAAKGLEALLARMATTRPSTSPAAVDPLSSASR